MFYIVGINLGERASKYVAVDDNYNYKLTIILVTSCMVVSNSVV